jgi:hypothetical protein
MKDEGHRAWFTHHASLNLVREAERTREIGENVEVKDYCFVIGGDGDGFRREAKNDACGPLGEQGSAEGLKGGWAFDECEQVVGAHACDTSAGTDLDGRFGEDFSEGGDFAAKSVEHVEEGGADAG